MKRLCEFLSQDFTSVKIDFSSSNWQVQVEIPSGPGWYYVRTDTPFEILARQSLWARPYDRAKTGFRANVKNYDLRTRCARFAPGFAEYWNTEQVYSGLAANLQARARDHTFADPGTAGLALARYAELHEYDWSFHYATLEAFMPNCSNPDVLLLLGEQVWRSRNGWPILCAE